MPLRLVILVATLLCFVPRGYAGGRPGPIYGSIELAVAQADVVVFGHVIGQKHLVPPAAAGAGSDPLREVTLQVDRGLVGAASGTQVRYWDWKTTSSSPSAESRLYVLTQSPLSKVLFLNRVPLTWSEVEAEESGRIVTDAEERVEEIPSMSLERFGNRDELLQAILPYCKRPAAPLVWDNISAVTVPNRGTATLAVPVDVRSEALARRWIRDKNFELQWDGVAILRWRKSPTNAALLRTVAKASPTGEPDEVMRERALAAILEWGEPVASIPRIARPPWSKLFDPLLWLSIFLVAAVPWAYWQRAKRRSVEARFWRVASTMWVAIFVITVVLWLRGYRQLDAICWGRWEVASVRGSIYAIRESAPGEEIQWPFEYCSAASLRSTVADAFLGDETDSEYLWGGLWRSEVNEAYAPMQWPERQNFQVHFRVVTFALAIWAMIVLGCRRLVRRVRRRRHERRRGFPVEVGSEVGRL